jgi:glycosyltransferase involved in cell wall biosynthesis
MPARFLLAIPVFNEEKYIVDVVRNARQYCRDVLVIDDGSTDRTGDLLNDLSGVRVLTHAENRGYGKSLADAFGHAASRAYDWLITMDADEQHEASYLPRFMHAALSDRADVISGTRYSQGWVVDASVPPDRREINRTITHLLNRELGLSITDAFCGFKAYRVSALNAIRITVPGYAMPMQFWVQAARAGLRIEELPVRLIYHDPARHFGGLLDDPTARLQHYLEVFESERASQGLMDRPTSPCTAGC